MTSPIVKSLIDEQIEEIERSLGFLAFGVPFNEVIGRPRDEKVCDLPVRLGATIQGRRIDVRVRHEADAQ